MNKVTIKTQTGQKLKARLTDEQLSYLLSLAADNGIEIKEKGSNTPIQEEEPSSTPITDEHLIKVSLQTGRSLEEIVQLKSSLGVETLEEVMMHSDVPREVKSLIEGYL